MPIIGPFMDNFEKLSEILPELFAMFEYTLNDERIDGFIEDILMVILLEMKNRKENETKTTLSEYVYAAFKGGRKFGSRNKTEHMFICFKGNGNEIGTGATGNDWFENHPELKDLPLAIFMVTPLVEEQGGRPSVSRKCMMPLGILGRKCLFG